MWMDGGGNKDIYTINWKILRWFSFDYYWLINYKLLDSTFLREIFKTQTVTLYLSKSPTKETNKIVKEEQNPKIIPQSSTIPVNLPVNNQFVYLKPEKSLWAAKTHNSYGGWNDSVNILRYPVVHDKRI